MHRFHSLPLLVLASIPLGCDASEASRDDARAAVAPPAPTMAALEPWFVVERSLTLEESPEAVTIEPVVTLAAGEILVAEPKEAQVRRYDRDGALLELYGRRGGGPGELQHPFRARRLATGGIAVADLTQPRLTVYDEGVEARTLSVPVVPLNDFFELERRRFLLAGPVPETTSGFLLHIWNAQSDSIEWSGFRGPANIGQDVSEAIGFAVPTRLSDGSVAVLHSLSDVVTLYQHDLASAVTVTIPFSEFVPVTAPPGPDAGLADRQEWLDRLIQPFDLFELGVNGILVQFARSHGRQLEWGLIGMSREGDKWFELRSTPRLLAADDSLYFFVDPSSPTPNRWVAMRWRQP